MQPSFFYRYLKSLQFSTHNPLLGGSYLANANTDLIHLVENSQKIFFPDPQNMNIMIISGSNLITKVDANSVTKYINIIDRLHSLTDYNANGNLENLQNSYIILYVTTPFIESLDELNISYSDSIIDFAIMKKDNDTITINIINPQLHINLKKQILDIIKKYYPNVTLKMTSNNYNFAENVLKLMLDFNKN